MTAYVCKFVLLNTFVEIRVSTDEGEAAIEEAAEHLAEKLGMSYLYKEEVENV